HGCAAKEGRGHAWRTNARALERASAIRYLEFSTLSSGASACGGYDIRLRCDNFVKPLASYTCKLTDEQAATLKSCLEARNYKFREVPYARFAGEKEKTNVVFYDSGKLVVQGKGTQEFIEFILEPEVLKQARLGYEAVLNPDLLLPRLGVDESGKGDF